MTPTVWMGVQCGLMAACAISALRAAYTLLTER